MRRSVKVRTARFERARARSIRAAAASTETVRLVEDTVLKTAARKGRGFDSLSLRCRSDGMLSRERKHADAPRRHATPYIWSRGSAARAAALQADNRWFESTRDYWKKGEGGRPKNTRSSLPPSPLPPSSALVVQPGVDACLSRRRSWVQIPSRALMARYANRQSGEAQTFATLWVRLPPLPPE
jgi:hypothetical protein